jgi:hypothetical protein
MQTLSTRPQRGITMNHRAPRKSLGPGFQVEGHATRRVWTPARITLAVVAGYALVFLAGYLGVGR